MIDYPWYTVVEDNSLEQGDLLLSVRLFFPPPGLSTTRVSVLRTSRSTSIGWKSMSS